MSLHTQRPSTTIHPLRHGSLGGSPSSWRAAWLGWSRDAGSVGLDPQPIAKIVAPTTTRRTIVRHETRVVTNRSANEERASYDRVRR
jgi:hypothetical protein